MSNNIIKKQQFKVSCAPMMDWTDRHCRWFHRQLSRHIRLYTEMVVAHAIIHGPRDRLLGFDPAEHYVALQIGGSDPAKLAQACEIANDWNYDEINLNVGCPSDRVQSGRFGACLMAEPDLVADCFQAMQGAAKAPVTIKCRLGIDDQDVQATLPTFLRTLESAGCQHIIIHARKAWLKGLSPKENRTIPPIDYDLVHQMKREFPSLEIVVNGQITDCAHAKTIIDGKLDGAMFGRAAYQNPWMLTEVDSTFFGASVFTVSREDIVQRLIDYLARREDQDRTAKALIRHVMGLYAQQAGGRMWRRTLSEAMAEGLRPSKCLQLGLETRSPYLSAA